MKCTKPLDPSNIRFHWSYDHVICRDTKTGKTWTRFCCLWKDGNFYGYLVRNSGTLQPGEYRTEEYTRKTTAVRGLMRLIASTDKKGNSK